MLSRDRRQMAPNPRQPVEPEPVDDVVSCVDQQRRSPIAVLVVAALGCLLCLFWRAHGDALCPIRWL
jgi:hypothetical protein